MAIVVLTCHAVFTLYTCHGDLSSIFLCGRWPETLRGGAVGLKSVWASPGSPHRTVGQTLRSPAKPHLALSLPFEAGSPAQQRVIVHSKLVGSPGWAGGSPGRGTGGSPAPVQQAAAGSLADVQQRRPLGVRLAALKVIICLPSRTSALLLQHTLVEGLHQGAKVQISSNPVCAYIAMAPCPDLLCYLTAALIVINPSPVCASHFHARLRPISSLDFRTSLLHLCVCTK